MCTNSHIYIFQYLLILLMQSSIHHSIYLDTILTEERSSEVAFPATVLWILISASTCLWYWLALLSVFLLSLSSITRTLDCLKSGRTGRLYVHKQQNEKNPNQTKHKTKKNPTTNTPTPKKNEHNLLHSYSSKRMKEAVGTDLSRQINNTKLSPLLLSFSSWQTFS